MNKELLIEVGQALYGDNWQSNLARNLDINPRTIRYWLSEKREIPPWVPTETIELLENSITKQESTKNKLKDLTKSS